MNTSRITAICRGLTLIELLVVISIAAMLSAVAAPSAVQAMRRGAMNADVSAVIAACHEARSLALAHDPPRVGDAYACFGVVVLEQGGSYEVAVTYGRGSTPGAGEILVRKAEPWRSWSEYQAAADELDANGQPIPVYRKALGPGLEVHQPASDDPLADAPAGTVGWLFQHQSGAVIATCSPVAPWVHVGREPLLVLRDADASRGVAIQIVPTGLVHVLDLEKVP